MGNPALYFFN